VFKLGSTLNKQPEKQQLQIDSSEALFEKVPDFDGVKVMQIAAGAEHSAAVTGKRGGAILLFLSSLHSANIKQTTFECLAENGEVKTWGWGEHGQLGLGNTNDQTSPELVSLGSIDLRTKEIKVYFGSGFTYAVKRKQELSPTSS